MKSRLLGNLILMAVILAPIHTAFAEKMLYDDFSKPYIDVQKWGPREFVREVDQATGKLISKLGYNASDNNRNTTVFQDPASIHSIAALISVNETASDALYAANGFARLEGYFYNSEASGTPVGDIWVGLYIGDRGLGLEAWWKVKEVMNDYLSEWRDVGGGTLITPGVLSYGKEFDVELAYDGQNGFTFSVAGVKDTFAGPTRRGESSIQYKSMTTGGDYFLEKAVTRFADITVDGGASDWDQVVRAAEDPKGDAVCGDWRDLKSVATAMDDVNAYLLVETYEPLDPEAVVNLIIDYKPGQHIVNGAQDDLSLSIAGGKLSAWNDADLNGSNEPYPLTGTVEVVGNVMEVSIPLAELENADYFNPTVIFIYDAPEICDLAYIPYTGYVSASFDNVRINGDEALYDDFAMAPLNIVNWQNEEVVKEVVDGKLRLSAHSEGDIQTSDVYMTNAPYVEAKVSIKKDSVVVGESTGIAGITGWYYNAIRGEGSGLGYNRYEGDVLVHNALNLSQNGTLAAAVFVGQANGAELTESSISEVFFHVFSTPIEFDKEYKLSIGFTGTQLIFSCDDEIVAYDITTPAYTAYGLSRRLLTRIVSSEGSPGYLKAEFDGVVIDLDQSNIQEVVATATGDGSQSQDDGSGQDVTDDSQGGSGGGTSVMDIIGSVNNRGGQSSSDVDLLDSEVRDPGDTENGGEENVSETPTEEQQPEGVIDEAAAAVDNAAQQQIDASTSDATIPDDSSTGETVDDSTEGQGEEQQGDEPQVTGSGDETGEQEDDGLSLLNQIISR